MARRTPVLVRNKRGAAALSDCLDVGVEASAAPILVGPDAEVLRDRVGWLAAILAQVIDLIDKQPVSVVAFPDPALALPAANPVRESVTAAIAQW